MGRDVSKQLPESLGPSRIVRWSINGRVEEKRFEHNVIATALWKVHMLGAEWARCFDDFGNQTRVFERDSALVKLRAAIAAASSSDTRK